MVSVDYMIAKPPPPMGLRSVVNRRVLPAASRSRRSWRTQFTLWGRRHDGNPCKRCFGPSCWARSPQGFLARAPEPRATWPLRTIHGSSEDHALTTMAAR
jgi:hypothetical protein